MLDNLIEVCYEKNDFFYNMMELINNPDNGLTEQHHIIPRNYFYNNGLEIIDKDNLVSLSPKNHLLVHYYAWKCSKPIIYKSMLSAYWLMSQKLISEGIIEKAEEYQLIKEEFAKNYGKKIICLDTREIFSSKREAARKYNLDRKTLNCVLKGEYYTVKNLHFENYIGEDSVEYCNNRIKEIDNYPTNKIKIICLNTLKVYSSLEEAAKDLNINHSGISNCINGKSKSTFGYYFEKYIEGKEYTKKEKNNRHINSKKRIKNIELNKEYSSIAKALKDIGRTNNGDFNILVKDTNYIFGYHWEILDKK